MDSIHPHTLNYYDSTRQDDDDALDKVVSIRIIDHDVTSERTTWDSCPACQNLCRATIAKTTSYKDDADPAPTRHRVEWHLCRNCDQIWETIDGDTTEIK